MKLADNMDRHKILDEFKFRPVRTIVFGVTCHLVPKNTIILPCPEHSLFSFHWIFMKVADNVDSHKILYEFDVRQDQNIHFGDTFP